MPLHRRQPFDSSPRSAVVLDYSRTLQSVFRQAVGYALASALGVSGCSAANDHPVSQPSATVSGPRQGARNQKPAPAKSHAVDTGGAGQGEPTKQQMGDPAEPSASDAGAPVKHAPRPAPVSVECPD